MPRAMTAVKQGLVGNGQRKPHVYADIKLDTCFDLGEGDGSQFVSAAIDMEFEEPGTLTIRYVGDVPEVEELHMHASELDPLILCLQALRERVAAATAASKSLIANKRAPLRRQPHAT
ncbi:MAG TPA: hypothetical protein VHE78_04670 [Gemmatimonadaceae bacterium]|nr:hypothetical protein [Gemmatimonadaceae bacterium]